MNEFMVTKSQYDLAIDRSGGADNMIRALSVSLYPNAAPESVRMVLEYCKASGLDPMLKPVHIVPMYDAKARGMRDVIMPSVGLYRIQAARTGEYAGISEPEFGPVTEVAGIKVPEWCRITVYRMIGGAPRGFTSVEYWEENYATKGRDSAEPNAMWSRRRRGQIAKCAEAQALRKAFPEIGNAPTGEEMEGKEIDISASATVTRTPEPVKTLPEYSPESFAVNFPAWEKMIQAGKKSADDVIGMVATKYVLSDEQIAQIKGVKNENDQC